MAVLVAVDLALIAAGLFQPRYPTGDPDLGIWLKRPGNGVEVRAFVPELAGVPVVGTYTRNEAGFASSSTMTDFSAGDGSLRLVSLGDSHTDLYYDFDHTHMGVMQQELRDAGRQDAAVLGAGHGFYSILQSWIMYQQKLAHLAPDVVILNLYTGNDLYDIIRRDDRPYLVPEGDGSYGVRPPHWVAYAPLKNGPYWSRSRIVYASHLALGIVGLEHLFAKVQASWISSTAYGGDPWSSISYIDDLRASRDGALWYEGAASAQARTRAS